MRFFRPVRVLCVPRSLLVSAAAFAALVGLLDLAYVRAAGPAKSGPLAGKVVAVDAGHGGEDGGVYHAGEGLLEKEINLDIARRVARRLEQRGGRAVLTRNEDREYFVETRKDLGHRLDLAYSSKAQVFISLHANSFPDPSQFGAQTFFDPKSAEGRRLARLIQEELVRIHPENYREALAADLFVLRENRLPAVLIEVGFVSNPDDRSRLRDTAYRDKLAEAVVRGLERWFAGEGAQG